MKIFKGSATFSGIAIGRVLYYHREISQVRQCFVSNVKKEIADFEKARQKVTEEIQTLYGEESHVKRRQMSLLEKGSFVRAVKSMIETEKVSAAYAVSTTRDELSQTFRNLEEPAVKERIEDVRELSERFISVLGGLSTTIFLGEKPVILVAETLSPGEILEMEKEKLLAVVTHQGSEISHASIMAKTIGIPALVDVEIEEDWDGLPAVVDGYTGTLYLDPDAELLKEYEARLKAEQEEKEELLKLKNKEAITLDGHRISLYANIANLDDLNSVLFYGAEGIGLLRSEFQYLGRENYPRENELFRAYKKVAETMGECLAVIRTVDLGADKQAAYMDIPEETNPIMGNRGIRLCLDRKRMFKAQLRAIYRASAYGNLAVMYPMISALEELDEIERITEQVKAGLREKGIAYKDIPVSVMIETPAAVMMSREIAERVDFLSLGTNDLAQYTLAMDRQNPLLKEKYNDHNPAILKMIQMVIQGAHEEKKKVFICGELAADTALTETFLKMGVDGLSVVPACISSGEKGSEKKSERKEMKEERSKKSTVVLLPCEDYNEEAVYEKLKEGLSLLGGVQQFLSKEEKILLKPNLLKKAEIERAVITHPSVVGGLVRILREEGYKNLVLSDSCGTGTASKVIKGTGMDEVLEKYHVPVIDYKEGVRVPFSEGTQAKEFILPPELLEADSVISISKMKTHALERITGAVKNSYGFVYGLHKAKGHTQYPSADSFARMLIDLNKCVKPKLYIMDGITAMEGNGPGSGDPVAMKVMLLSADPVALDSVFCYLVSLKPSLVPTNYHGEKMGLGTCREENIRILTPFGEMTCFQAAEKYGKTDFQVDRTPVRRNKWTKLARTLRIFQKKPYIVESRCISCGVCVKSCPVQGKAVDFKNGKGNPPVYDYKKCIRCFCCQEMCPEKAIQVK